MVSLLVPQNIPLSASRKYFETYIIPVAKLYGSVKGLRYFVTKMSSGARVLTRQPEFGHQTEPQERGMAVNDPSVHKYTAPIS